jgi:hypothetical protein
MVQAPDLDSNTPEEKRRFSTELFAGDLRERCKSHRQVVSTLDTDLYMPRCAARRTATGSPRESRETPLVTGAPGSVALERLRRRTGKGPVDGRCARGTDGRNPHWRQREY